MDNQETTISSMPLAPPPVLLSIHRKLHLIMRSLANGATIGQQLRELCEVCALSGPDRVGSLLMYRETSQTLHPRVDTGLPDFYNKAIEGVSVGPTVGSCGAAAHYKKIFIAEDLQAHPNWAPFAELTSRASLGACWSAPIITSSGKLLGTFAIYNKYPTAPEAWELELLETAAGMASLLLELHDSYEALAREAREDPLTGLSNRAQLRSLILQLAHTASRKGEDIAIGFADIRVLKKVNDTLGHSMGDEVIIAAASALRVSLRLCDVVARYGGDEFVLAMLLSRDPSHDLDKIVKRIESSFEKAAPTQALALGTGLDIGFQIIRAADAENLDIEGAIERADEELYVTKARSRAGGSSSTAGTGHLPRARS